MESDYESDIRPIQFSKNRRFVITLSTLVTVGAALWVISSNYFEMRSSDKAASESIQAHEARLKTLEMFMFNLNGDIREIKTDVKATKENVQRLSVSRGVIPSVAEAKQQRPQYP